MMEVLSISEAKRLSDCEAVIEQGLQTFYEVGSALAEIRDLRLYRAIYPTFEGYCRERWSMSKTHANRLIESNATIENLTPIGVKPATESQARELAPLNDQPELQRQVWQHVVENAPQGKVTAAYVREVVEQMTDVERDTVKKMGKLIARVQDEKNQKDNLLKFPADSQDTCTVDDLDRLIERGVRFGTIYLDPPWCYGNQATRSATDNHYPTMTIEEIAALPVAELAAQESHIYLWTTNAFLHDSFHLLEQWGFTYKSLLVWDKERYGIGNYWRLQTEYLLLANKGGLGVADKSNRNIIREESKGHSVKPHVIRKMIESMSPSPRLEMFARRVATGWTCWGNEIERTMFDNDIEEVA